MAREYRIISGLDDRREFEKGIENLLLDGWQLVGGLSVVERQLPPKNNYPQSEIEFFQAITK